MHPFILGRICEPKNNMNFTKDSECIPRVCQMTLLCLEIWQNKKFYSPTDWQIKLTILASWKTCSPHAHISTCVSSASRTATPQPVVPARKRKAIQSSPSCAQGNRLDRLRHTHARWSGSSPSRAQGNPLVSLNRTRPSACLRSFKRARPALAPTAADQVFPYVGFDDWFIVIGSGSPSWCPPCDEDRVHARCLTAFRKIVAARLRVVVKTVDRIGCGSSILFLPRQNGKLLEEKSFHLAYILESCQNKRFAK